MLISAPYCIHYKSQTANIVDFVYRFSFTFILDTRFHIQQDSENKNLNITELIFDIVEIKPLVFSSFSIPSKLAKTVKLISMITKLNSS